MIYYYGEEYDLPSGGNWALYRHVDVLNAAGLEAAMLHKHADFRLSWFENTTRVLSFEEVEPGAGDIVVIPGHRVRFLDRLFPKARKVILNQGAYMTLTQYKTGYTGDCNYDNAIAAIVTSEDTRQYLSYVFPDMPIHRVFYGIDPKLFYYDPALKKDQIVFSGVKDQNTATQVVWMLRRRGLTMDIVSVKDVNHEQVAAAFRESRMYLNFCIPEGFGLPPAEAMACGCQVVGWNGIGGAEFFKEPYALPLDYSDVKGYVDAVEGLLEGRITLDVQGASAFIHQHYSPETERESLVAAWNEILAL